MNKVSKVLTAGFTAALMLAPAFNATAGQAEEMTAMGEKINAQLEAEGRDFHLFTIEWLNVDGSVDEGQNIVYFKNVGNKQLSADWVPNDSRRFWNPTDDITYLVDLSDGNTNDGPTAFDTDAAIDRAMDTWEDDTNCSSVRLPKVADPQDDPDLVDALIGCGPPPGPGWPYADIVHGGWVNGAGVPCAAISAPTLGVTYTFVFTGTDVNNDHKSDTAFREIYYNDQYVWRINGNIDVETVALHEAGHGLSQGHFGQLHQTTSNGRFHFSPRAVMNAGYTGVQQNLKPTDLAGHCSIWGNWPNR